MSHSKKITHIPWDTRIFGFDCYEIHEVKSDIMKEALEKPGHFTIRVNPRLDKRLLHDFGFYYCDTLVIPHCRKEHFQFFKHQDVDMAKENSPKEILDLADGAFYGRFHRDFNIDPQLADLRFSEWIKDFDISKEIFSLQYRGKLAAFFAFKDHKIRLHAIGSAFKGQGLAKYLWSLACRELFQKGYQELESSISISNSPVVNLYYSLGFKFKDATDIYHKLVQ